jgi:hypothetical protein
MLIWWNSHNLFYDYLALYKGANNSLSWRTQNRVVDMLRLARLTCRSPLGLLSVVQQVNRFWVIFNTSTGFSGPPPPLNPSCSANGDGSQAPGWRRRRGEGAGRDEWGAGRRRVGRRPSGGERNRGWPYPLFHSFKPPIC